MKEIKITTESESFRSSSLIAWNQHKLWQRALPPIQLRCFRSLGRKAVQGEGQKGKALAFAERRIVFLAVSERLRRSTLSSVGKLGSRNGDSKRAKAIL